MIEKLFGWVNDIPELTRSERDAYKVFHIFVIASYLFWVRMAVFPFVGGAALLVDRGVKAIFILSFIWFIVKATNAGVLGRMWNPVFSRRACLTLAFVIYVIILGFYYNGSWARPWNIISVGIYFVTMTFVIAMGRGGDYFRCNWKLFLILFYITTILIIATSNVQLIRLEAGTDIEREIDEYRGTTALSYQFRGVLQFALFFFLLACLWHKRISVISRTLMFLTIVPYAYFQIYVQKFRSHILLLGLALFFAAFYSLKAGKVKSLILISLIAISGISLYFSKAMIDTRDRVENATIHASDAGNAKNKIVAAFLGERGGEFESFWKTFPLHKKIFGGGASGYFDAHYWGRGDHWDTIHIGFFKMMLIGGVPLFVFFLGFFTKAFTRRMSEHEKIDGFVPACQALTIIIFLKNWVNPILAGDACFEFFIIWLALGALWSPPSRLLKMQRDI